MSQLDHCRRAVSLVLAVLVMVLAPQIATAAFTSNQRYEAQVATARLVMPAGITGSYRCQSGLLGASEGANATVTGFSDPGQPTRAAYVYRLSTPTTIGQSVGSAPGVRTASFSVSQGSDGRATSYRVDVYAKVGGWTSPVGSATFTCAMLSTASGTF